MKKRYGLIGISLCLAMIMISGCGKSYSTEVVVSEKSNEDETDASDLANEDSATDSADDANETSEADAAEQYEASMALLNEWSDEAGKKINNTEYLIDKGENILYASLGPAEPDYPNPYDESEMVDSYIDVVYIDSDLEVKEAGRIELIESDPDWGDELLVVNSYGIYDFGESQHYYVTIYGVGYGYQYKYGNVAGVKKLIDSELEFIQNDDGIYCISQRGWGEYYNTATEYVEVTFVDDEYKQYTASDVSLDEAGNDIQNWQEAVDECISDLSKLDFVQLSEQDGDSITDVRDIELTNVKLGNNGKYYLTFKFTADSVYSDEIYYKDAYFTFRLEEGCLVREEGVNYIEKLETSEVNIPAI